MCTNGLQKFNKVFHSISLYFLNGEQKMKFAPLLALLSLSLLCHSCYRMPGEDEYCLIPSTNNPSVTHERPQAPVPQLSY